MLLSPPCPGPAYGRIPPVLLALAMPIEVGTSMMLCQTLLYCQCPPGRFGCGMTPHSTASAQLRPSLAHSTCAQAAEVPDTSCHHRNLPPSPDPPLLPILERGGGGRGGSCCQPFCNHLLAELKKLHMPPHGCLPHACCIHCRHPEPPTTTPLLPHPGV